jgi:hypothetical protein
MKKLITIMVVVFAFLSCNKEPDPIIIPIAYVGSWHCKVDGFWGLDTNYYLNISNTTESTYEMKGPFTSDEAEGRVKLENNILIIGKKDFRVIQEPTPKGEDLEMQLDSLVFIST